MKTLKKIFCHLFSQIREKRKNIFFFVLGLVFMYVFGLGVYHIGRKEFYVTKYCFFYQHKKCNDKSYQV